MIKAALKAKNPAEMRAAFEHLRKVRGASLQAELRRRARIMAVDCAKHTPPFQMASGGKSILTQGWATQKKAGLLAVQGDINRVYSTLKTLKIASSQQPHLRAVQKQLAKYTSRGNIPKIEAILRRFGINTPVIKEADPLLHKKARNSRGRIGSSRARVIVLRPASIKRYIKKVQQRVGYTKAGWMAALRHLGTPPGVPIWVTRHSTPGSISDNTDKGSGIQSIKVENRVPWRGGLSALRIVEHVWQVNGRKMDREAKEIIRGKLKKAMREKRMGR